MKKLVKLCKHQVPDPDQKLGLPHRSLHLTQSGNFCSTFTAQLSNFVGLLGQHK